MKYSIREIGENIKKLPSFKGNVLFDEPMALRTTMKVGGRAALFVEPYDALSAAASLAYCRLQELPVFTLGGGSNLVVSDEGFDCAVISTSRMNSIQLASVHQSVEVTCGCGTKMNALADFCAKYGLTGMECFAGLPGTVGGATYMNARCYEKNVSDVLVCAEYIDLTVAGGETPLLAHYNMNLNDWAYKKSPFQTKASLITAATFKLTALDDRIADGHSEAAPLVQDKIHTQNDHFIQDRICKGHFKAPSAGSVFKNNHDFGKPSGVLIDEAGLKGTAVGGAQVAPWHGNFIINNGNATAADIHSLVSLVQQKVCDKTGFMLEPEIIFCGKGFTSN